MESKKKLLLLMLISLLLISTLTVIVSAENTTSTAELKIKSFSLSLENAVYMNFKVSYENVSPNDVKLLVWTNVPEAYEKGAEDDCLSVRQIEDGTGYAVFQYDKLAAKDMTKTVYVCAYAEVDGNAVYSDPAKFSIAMYAYQKKHASNPDTDLVALMDSMLAYGAAAQTYFNYNTDFLATDEVHMVRVANGKLSDGFALGWYQEGSQIAMTANEPADGYVFSHWKNSAGEEVGTEETLTVSVTKVDTYTAVYKPLYQISVVNGTVNNASSGFFAEGSTVTLVANEPADGCVFSRWTNSLGETVGTTETLTLTVTQAETYHAVHEEIIFSSKGLAFNPKADGTYSVSKGTCTDTNIIIPATYNGKAVTEIEANAFYYCSSITSITIPDSVTSIGEQAFYQCTSLTSITIPDNVTNISKKAFYMCRSLTSVTIGKNVVIIGNSAFYNCTNLTSITIPNSVTDIYSDAFYNCTRLTSITIGNSVETIASDAFRFCTELKRVYITDIAKWCNISFGFYQMGYTSNPLFYGGKLYLIGEDGEAELITNLVIPDGVTTIRVAAFCGCTSLTSITIPTSVTSISDYAFSNCTGLTSVTIGNGVKSIGNSAFKYCTSLTSVTIGSNTESIGAYAFAGCARLTSITIPNNVTSIGNYAFEECYNLVEVYNLSSHITVKKGSTAYGYIGYYAFDVYTSADTPSKVWSNSDGFVFYENGSSCYLLGYKGTASELILPESCKGKGYVINNGAFYCCEDLISITISNNITGIGSHAFRDCTGLTNICYSGTQAQWEAISKGSYWDYGTGDYTITYNYTGE